MFFKRKIIITTILFVCLVLMVISPEICTMGAQKGLLISGNIIIPSLFPITVIVLIMLQYDFSIINSKISNLIFGQSPQMFFVMLLSMLGGYPMGAKLIDKMYTDGKITKREADFMLMYCVNAGPAFLIIAVGNGILNSKNLGAVLCFSHLFSSLLISLIVSCFIRKQREDNAIQVKVQKIKFSEVFVDSTAQAASSVLNVCTFIILFSVINAYLEYFAAISPIFKYLSMITEVTNSVTQTNNIILISFLLGFSGISVWCQIFSLSRNVEVNKIMFICGRLLHGTISSVITLILIKSFNITTMTVSNQINVSGVLLYDNLSLTLSLTITVGLFFIFLF